jgi:ribosome biogenesis protein MAK21
MSSGTLSDKISALTLVVQESPLHNVKAFENLLGLAKKRSRSQAIGALGALKDLLGQGVVLPPERKLYSFGKQPGLLGALEIAKLKTWMQGDPLPGSIQQIHLVAWQYEDWLKATYFEMLKILESWCNDEVEFARSQALAFVWELLKEKPEQEANLLRLLVNKLGDPDKKISSKASYLLLKLETTHPLMKPVIIASIQSEVLFRPGQSLHAQYYAIITLNQTILSSKEENVASKLLNAYFSMFVGLLKAPAVSKDISEQTINKKGDRQGGGAKMGRMAKKKAEVEEKAEKATDELKEKLISAVLTGINRSFPFSDSDDSV